MGNNLWEASYDRMESILVSYEKHLILSSYGKHLMIAC